MTTEQRSRERTSQRSVLPKLARLAEVAQILLPGTYAWAVTVVPTALATTGSVVPKLSATAALLSLTAGAILARRHATAGYALGIWGFLLGCVATWCLGAPSLQIDRLDPWRAGAGSIGWVLFALGWGTRWRIRHDPEDDPRAQIHPKLDPRSPPQLRTVLSVAIGTIGAIACLLIAWRSVDQYRALLLHGAALVCAIAIVNASSTIGLAQGARRTPFRPRQRITYAFPWIMAASALVVIGVTWLFRHP